MGYHAYIPCKKGEIIEVNMQDLIAKLHGLKSLYKLAKTKQLLAHIEKIELEIHKLRCEV